MLSLAMVLAMIPVSGISVYAEEPEYTVTINPFAESDYNIAYHPEDEETGDYSGTDLNDQESLEIQANAAWTDFAVKYADGIDAGYTVTLNAGSFLTAYPACRHVGNLGCWHKAVHVLIEVDGGLVTVDGHTLL